MVLRTVAEAAVSTSTRCGADGIDATRAVTGDELPGNIKMHNISYRNPTQVAYTFVGSRFRGIDGIMYKKD
jgi:hypothetical protein